MNDVTPTWALVVQAVASIATVANLAFVFYQLRLMQRQVNAAKESIESQRLQLESQIEAQVRTTQGANVFQLLSYLEEPRHLEARAISRTLADKEYSDWSDDERSAADLTARLWTQAGIIQKLGILPENFLQYYYGGSISRSWKALKPFVEDLRSKSDPAQRLEFEEIANEVDSRGLFKDGDHRPVNRYEHLQRYTKRAD